MPENPLEKGGQGGPPVSSEADKKAEAAKAFEATKYTELTSNVEALVRQVETPILIHAADELISKYEDEDFHNEGYKNDYAFMYILDSITDRERNLKLTKEDLNSLGIIKEGTYDSEKDQAVFEIGGYSYKRKKEEISMLSEIIEKASGEVDKVYRKTQIEVDIVGSDEQRRQLSSTINSLKGEMIARQDLTKMYGAIVRNTENLDGIVQELYYRLSMTPKAMEIFFNALARSNTLKKTEGGIEYNVGKERGQARDAAVRCLEIVGCAEDYKKLEDILKRPGIKYLFNVSDEEIDLLFVPENKRGGRQINPILKEWIGDPSTWKDANGAGRKKKKEGGMDNEIRGKLTKKGNIFVETEQDDRDLILKNIEDFVSAKGEQTNNGSSDKTEPLKREAENVVSNAWRWFRVIGKATTYGFTYYDVDGELKPFSDMGGVTSCDRIKVMYPEVFRDVYKRSKPEIRDWGPDGSFGKYERFGVDYDKGLSFETAYGKRTVDEIRWGYREDRSNPREILPFEEATRYGDLEYKTLNAKIFNKCALGMYIAGRPEIGIFQYIMNVDWKSPKEFQSKDFWTKFAKHMGISLSTEVVLDGKYRGLKEDEIKQKTKEYKKRVFLAFWDGLRSLPQWREWMSMESERLETGGKYLVSWVDRIKYYMGKTDILSAEEISKLSKEPFIKDQKA